jgi:hypothetical protein
VERAGESPEGVWREFAGSRATMAEEEFTVRDRDRAAATCLPARQFRPACWASLGAQGAYGPRGGRAACRR